MYIISFWVIVADPSLFLMQGGPELDGIYVKSLLPGGAAEASGKIRNGTRRFHDRLDQ